MEISYRTVADNAICEEILRQVFQDVWARPNDFNNEKNYLFSLNRMLSNKNQLNIVTKVVLVIEKICNIDSPYDLPSPYLTSEARKTSFRSQIYCHISA
ncbi:hypothetical protein [Paenisporosarcina sp. OV554]|uniref:hypothetical protein n=1 Tax=Paenisporosarcina sp. OV554 TaxID=2135694 RepID=UPI001E3C1B88|nr:hypothetical protein [Paenisporosarcina sp. OV554]